MQENVNNRIVYSNEQLLLSLDTALSDLGELKTDRYRLQLGDDFKNKLLRWDRDIRSRKNDPFTIVVVGDFKRGKSSLINALLNEDVAPTDVIPETATMNRISYGTHANKALLSNNRQLILEDSELTRYELMRIMEGLNETITSLELTRPNELLKKITIIDTPGTYDAMMNFNDLVKESLLQADAVLYVYNVAYPLSHTEQLWLKSAILPHQFTTLLLVGNFSDTMVTMENYEKQRHFLTERINGLLPNANVVMLSALDERCLQLGETRPSPELQEILEKEFSSFRRLLDDLVEEKKDTVLSDRMRRMVNAMTDDLSAEMDALEKGISMTTEKDAEAVTANVRKEFEAGEQNREELESQIDQKISEMKKEAKTWMTRFTERIAEESRDLDADVDTLFKYYEAYCIDKMQEAVTICMNQHEDQLYELLDEFSSELSKRLAEAPGRSMESRFSISLNNRIWTKGDTAGLVISQIGGFFGFDGGLLVNALAGAMRSKEKKEKTPDIKKEIAAQMTELSVSANSTIDNLYDELGTKAKRLASEYYSEKMEETKRLTKKMAKAAGKKTKEKQKIQQTIDEARNILNSVKVSVCGE